MELLPFVDILKVFNNPINEEQAWAVCYQCANFLAKDSPQQQEFFQDIYDSGIQSIWLSRHGDVFIRKGPPEPNGSGKGPPSIHHGIQTTSSSHRLHSPTSSHGYRKSRGHVIATETDAVQALGTSIFEALDYGIDPTEERQLSHELESLITTMTSADNSMDDDHELQNADDEGIEKDADLEHKCLLQDVLKICHRHLSSKQDAQHHYKAVCRALATEAGELFTFLERISTHKEKLSETLDEDSKRLDELQRADWACLWVQVTRSLRQGVRLKKVEHVSLPPLEYELTPFEMLLEDIRSRRYTLNKISQADNGQLPHKVKNDAHAYILEFIRSRPPLKKVDERKLKPKPPSPPDPHELLLKEIRSRPKLRSIRQGKLLVEKPKVGLSDELEAPPPTKRVIKADLSLLMNNCSEDSSEDEDCTSNHSLGSPQSLAPTMMAPMSWQRAVTKEVLINGTSGSRPTRLQRRHTIMVCDSSMDGKVQSQELPPLTEEEEPSPVRENPLSHQFSPLGVAGGATLLHRTSFSEHDLSNQITLRNPHLRARTVLEHRRSLTSIPTGLTSIPEMDDVFGGMDSPPKPGAIRRSWSHEQAPPPNPSPPCKGRARSAMIMSGTKTVGRNVTQPSAFKRHVSSSPKSASMSEITSMYTTNTSKPQTISSSLHASNRPQSQAPSTKHVSNKSSRMQKTLQNPLLDMDVSIQSPGYFKSPFSVSTPSLETLSSEGKTQRDSPSRTLSERSSGYTSRPNTDSPKRKIIVNKEELQRQSLTTTFGIEAEDVFCDQDVSSDKPIHNVQIASTNDILISRRPSLDGGMSLYSGATPGSTLRNRPNTRNSLTEKREGRLKPFKSPEEEERLTRWRMLQEEELAHRQKKTPGEINLSSLPPKGRPDPEKTPRRPVTQDRHRYVDGTDVLQQKLQSEEARFARWRHLEETGISALKKENLLKASTDEPSSSPVHNLKTPALQTPTPDLNKSFLSTPLPKHWQNPVECLSLTLEEVTHIREVLTKAELESLISHPDLYQQVSKSKICFTCKTTKFSLFGEWGSKCKLCKRTVCSKCLRKMNIPTDHFKNIPVYTLSPAPLPTETHEFIQKFIKSAPPISVPPTRDSSPVRKCIIPDSHSDLEDEAPDSKNLSVKPVQRSHSVNITSGIKSTPRNILKGPLMAVCCDCKGMVMEIIRASRASLAMLSASSGSPATSMTHSPAPQSLLPNSPEMRKMVKK